MFQLVPVRPGNQRRNQQQHMRRHPSLLQFPCRQLTAVFFLVLQLCLFFGPPQSSRLSGALQYPPRPFAATSAPLPKRLTPPPTASATVSTAPSFSAPLALGTVPTYGSTQRPANTTQLYRSNRHPLLNPHIHNTASATLHLQRRRCLSRRPRGSPRLWPPRPIVSLLPRLPATRTRQPPLPPRPELHPLRL